MEPVGLRRRVGLLLEGGEVRLSGEGLLIRLLASSVPVKEPEDDDEEFKRREKRSKRDTPWSAPLLNPLNSFEAALMRLNVGPVSGSEPVRRNGRWARGFALPFSWVLSTDADL